MEKWLSCRRRWYYRYVGRFAPPPGLALLEGRLMHALFEAEAKLNMEVQHHGRTSTEAQNRQRDIESYARYRLDTLKPVFDEFSTLALAPFASYNPKNLEGMPVPYSESDVESSIDLIKRVYENWLILHGAQDLERYDFLSAEAHIKDLIIPRPQGGKTRGWRLGGILDGLLRDKNTGKLLLRELKTTKGNVSNYERRADIDPQIRLYAQAAELSGMTKGEEINIVQYIVLRKKLPSIPKDLKCKKCKSEGVIKKEETITKCESCKGNGFIPSADKRLDSTDLTVLKHLEKRDFAAKSHGKAELDWVHIYKGEDWYVDQRYVDLINHLGGWEKLISINAYYLDTHDKAEALWESWRVTQEIADATRRYQRHSESHITCFPRNTSQCTGPAGYCEYRQVCLSRVAVEDFMPESGWQTEMQDSPEIVEVETKE